MDEEPDGFMNQLRARHWLSKFLLRSGQRPAPGVKTWTQIYMAWIRQTAKGAWVKHHFSW
jgi:hypothetical protein